MKNAILIRRTTLSVFVLTGILLFSVAMNNALGSESGVKQATLKIDGMSCGGCVYTIKSALKKLQGVVSIDVRFKEAKATLSYYEDKVTVKQMIEAIESIGYKAYLITEDRGKQ